MLLLLLAMLLRLQVWAAVEPGRQVVKINDRNRLGHGGLTGHKTLDARTLHDDRVLPNHPGIFRAATLR